MIIDFHTHVDESPVFGWIDPPEKIVGLLDEAEIDQAVIMTYTDLPGLNENALEYILEATSRFPDRLIPFVRLNPNYSEAMPGLMAQALGAGIRGVKLHPTTSLAYPGGEPTVGVLRAAAEAGVPVLFHCGDDPYTTPQTLEIAAQQVPDCQVVFGHMGGYHHVLDAIDVAQRNDNVYLETSAMPYPELIRKAVDTLGSTRVVFGSDGPGCNPSLELRKVTGLGLPADQEADLLHRNADRLLGVGR